MIRGFFLTPTLIALLRVGFFDALARSGHLDIASFAQEHHLDHAALTALCDYLYALKILDREGSAYTLGPRGQLLTSTLAGSLYSAGAYRQVFHDLEPMLRGEKRYGVDVQRDPALAAQGSGEAGKAFIFPIVAEFIRRQDIKKVLDLGCGDAMFLTYLCSRLSDLEGYGIDISPEAIADGNRRVLRQGLDDRVQLFTGDMLNPHSLARAELVGIEAATCFFVLHEFLRTGTQSVLQMLSKFRDVFPNTRLIICESARHTPEQLRKRLGPLAEFQLVHDLSGQRPIPREAWRPLLHEAGFTSVRGEYFRFARIVVYTAS